MTKIFLTLFLLLNLSSYGQSENIDPITIKKDGTSKRFNYNDRMHHSHLITPGLRLTFWDSTFTKIKTQVTISDGKMNGIFKSFNTKGFLVEMCDYMDGLKNGYCYFWTDEGYMLKKEQYNKGVLKKTVKFRK